MITNIAEIEKKAKILKRDSVGFPYHKIAKTLETSDMNTKFKCFDDPASYISVLKNSGFELENSDLEKLKKCQFQMNMVSSRV